MDKYKLSSNEDAVVNLYGKNVNFLRGTGATFSVVYGAIKYADENEKSNVIVFGDRLIGFENNFEKLAEDNPVYTKFKVARSEGKRVISLFNKSTITFTTIDNIQNNNMIYDVAYVDSNIITDRQRDILPCIASEYCTVTTFE